MSETLMARARSEETAFGQSKVERYGWKIHDRKGEFTWIAKERLCFDHESYQRSDVVPAKVLDIAKNWSWIACGVISVAARGSEFFVMDGQYRTLAARRRDDIKDLPCLVFRVAEVKQEAKGFLGLNSNRKPITSRDRFKALIATEDDCAKFVQDLLKSTARDISNSNNRSARCLTNLLKWARTRPDTLKRVWPVLDQLCGSHSVHVSLLEAIMNLELGMPDGDSLALPRWRDRLLSIGFDQLLEACHKAQGFRGKGGGKVWAEGVVQRINHGLKNKLKWPRRGVDTDEE